MIGNYYCWLDFGNEPSIVQSRQSCCGCKDFCKETGQALNEGPSPSDPSPGPDVREALEPFREAVQVCVYYEDERGFRHPKYLNEDQLSALTRPLGGFVQGSIGTKQSSSSTSATATETAIEVVARIIDPERWAVLDNYLAETKRKYRGQHAGYDPSAFRDAASLAKSRTILASPEVLQALGAARR